MGASFSLSCCAGTFRTLSRAAAKSAAATFRQIGFGSVHPQWTDRAAICERCPLRVVHRGVSYCGNPLLRQIHREPASDGCGCPTRAKAKSAAEHCPLDVRHQPAVHAPTRSCNCKWCTLTAPSR
jgi:hypothetical protein